MSIDALPIDKLRFATPEETYGPLCAAYKKLCSNQNIDELLSTVEYCNIDFMMERLWSTDHTAREQSQAVYDAVKSEMARPEPRQDVLDILRKIGKHNAYHVFDHEDLMG
jgi:hypothetical protein